MKLIIDIPNSLYANLKKIANGSIASKRILDCVKNGAPFENQDLTKVNQGDLISREALIAEFKRRAVGVRNWKTDALNNSNEESVIRADAVLAYMVEVKAVIDNAPTVEARPHGEWICVDEDYGQYECSNCKTDFYIEHGTPQENEYDCCPKCSADMRGEE